MTDGRATALALLTQSTRAKKKLYTASMQNDIRVGLTDHADATCKCMYLLIQIHVDCTGTTFYLQPMSKLTPVK